MGRPRRVFVPVLAAIAALAALAVYSPVPASAASTWTIQTTALPPGRTHGALQGVSCLGTSSCTAVGFYVKNNAAQAMAEAWNGTTWAVQTAPSPAALNSSLGAVSCASSASCMAVGFFQVAANDVLQPLADHWNGSTWTIEPVPLPAGGVGSRLSGVACASSADCTAVGYYTRLANGHRRNSEVMDRWNGSTWMITAAPVLRGSELSAVSCTSGTSCVAVGSYQPVAHIGQVTLAEQWNGSTWTIQPTPNPAGAGASLAGIACSSATSCTAVGYHDTAVATVQTLAEHWNGSTWVIQPTPNPAKAIRAALYGISCPTASSCTAAATFAPTNFTATAAAEHWNGTAWKIQATAQPARAKHLASVSCVAASVCTAVGGIFTKGTLVALQQPLAEHE